MRTSQIAQAVLKPFRGFINKCSTSIILFASTHSTILLFLYICWMFRDWICIARLLAPPSQAVMSKPSPLTSGQDLLEEKREEVSVAISADSIAVDRAGNGGRPPLLSSIGKDEPIVTRRELWSYYRQSSFPSRALLPRLEFSFKVYYNGNNVCNFILFPTTCSKSVQIKGVGPNGYTMILFQSLANAAGYDPVSGPGSSCNASNASGQCVLPWGGGTKAVSSVVLIANGLSFAVSSHFNSISVVDHHLSLQGPSCPVHDTRLSR